ncbi:MAG TPA: DNA polymerase III subunit delta [Kofleriaceae bacterium]|nr:DNA polymerase III subunit delta [Kofleriaceae bacterium]
MELLPVYVIVSAEPLLMTRMVEDIKEQAVPPAARGFNLDVIQGKGATAQAILGAAQTLPMMAARRMVIVRDVHQMVAAELAALVPYLKDPNPSTTLVMTAPKIDGRIKLFATAKKLKVVHELSRPRNPTRWLADEAARRNVAIDAAARARLCDVVGADLARLSLCLEQLTIYAGEREIRADDVDDLIADTRERSVFELCDAIGAGNRRAALLSAAALMDQRQSAVGVVVMLARHFRQLGQCRAAIEDRVPQSDIGRRVGVPPFIVQKLLTSARRLSAGDIARAQVSLAAADRALKGESLAQKTLGKSLGERVLLERLCVKLAGLGSRPRR